MPISGCAISIADDQQQQCERRSDCPGKPRRSFCSENSQAVTTAKHGLTNSEGCSDSSGRLIQRRAPLISAPTTKVSASSTSPMPKTDEGDAAHRPRRLQRYQPHDADRHRQEGEIAAHEMHTVIADALGDGRARRQAHDDAETHQDAECGEAPSVDGPPPARHRALIDAGEPHAGRSSRRGNAMPPAPRSVSAEYILLNGSSLATSRAIPPTIIAHHRSFSVASPAIARIEAMIQKRMTMVGSCQPFFSK